MANIYLIFVCMLSDLKGKVYGNTSLHSDSSIVRDIVSRNDKQISIARAKCAALGSKSN